MDQDFSCIFVEKMLNTSIFMNNRTNGYFLQDDEIDIYRVDIDDKERAEFDSGNGFNPRIRRQEELITKEYSDEIKNGILKQNPTSKVENLDINLEFKARRMIFNFMVNLIMVVKE